MPKTILIAASDPNISYLLQRYAETSGFQVVSASQGKELQRLAAHLHPDLIILEIELPETPARQALHHLKASEDTNEIPVIVYSCYDEVNVTAQEGTAGTLQKSMLYSDFVTAVEQAGIQPD